MKLHVMTERITLKKGNWRKKMWPIPSNLIPLCTFFIGLNADCSVSSASPISGMVLQWCLNQIANTLKTAFLDVIFRIKSIVLWFVFHWSWFLGIQLPLIDSPACICHQGNQLKPVKLPWSVSSMIQLVKKIRWWLGAELATGNCSSQLFNQC